MNRNIMILKPASLKGFIGFAAILAVSACGNSRREIDATGTFEATEVVVSSEVNGRIISFTLNEGDRVDSGRTYGLIDTIQLSLKKEQLKAGINAASSRKVDAATKTAPLHEQIRAMEKERERVTNLIAANAANTKQLDDVNSGMAVLKKELQSSEYTIASANRTIDAEIAALMTQMNQIDDQLRRCRITAPLNGVVLAKYSEQGELTSMGKPIFKAADVENMYLRAYITAGQLSQIVLGQKVQILADGNENGGHRYEGTVAWISDKAEFTPRTIQTKDERANLVYAVKISFVNDGYVKIGMYGDVKF